MWGVLTLVTGFLALIAKEEGNMMINGLLSSLSASGITNAFGGGGVVSYGNSATAGARQY